ncbi:MAG: trypsin-like peptidase domain-containing protein [Solobacterium sp.]|nr:trypsin-like peptidase domain-containing protein [Solobacterium sp.]
MKKWILVLFAGLLVWNLWLTISLSSLSSAQPGIPQITQTTVTDYTTDLTGILEANRSSVVSIQSGTRAGSGFVYSREENDLYIITSSDLYSDSGEVTVFFDSSAPLTAAIVGRDEATGIMLLKLQPGFEVRLSKLADSSLIEQGEYVLAVSGRRNSTGSSMVSFGIVSEPGQRRLSSASLWPASVIETDAQIVQDCIGGPLLDQGGAVIGMLQGRSTVGSERLSVAVSINEVRLAAEELKTEGSVTRGSLASVIRSVADLRSYEKSTRGLQLDAVNGVLVCDVLSDNGILPGDVLLQINGETIRNSNDLMSRMYQYQYGDTVELQVFRDHETIMLSVVLE